MTYFEFRPDGRVVWTEEKVTLLRQLRDERLSCSAMGAALGTTRNAVIGKLHRLGLQAEGRKISMRPRAERRREQRAKAKALGTVNFAKQERQRAPHVDLRHIGAPASKKLGFLDLAGDQCHYPTGDGEFCGRPAVYPYCPFHWRLTHVPSRPR
jgi:hypothetical protein